MTRRLTLLICGIALLAACGKEPPPRTVAEFVENPLLLEAAMVRCSQDRSRMKYEAECINARQAVSRIQAKEEAERQKALEAQSERKRKAIRRAQEAAAEARRRAAQAEAQRREAEYLAQFGVSPPAEGENQEPLAEGNQPVAVVPEAPPPAGPDVLDEDANVVYEAAPPAVEGGNAPVAEPAPEVDPKPPADLASIRDELRRRNEEDDD